MFYLLHLQQNPGQVLERLAQFVSKDGALVVGGPNFDRVSTLARRLLGMKDYRRLQYFEQSGISVCGPRTLAPHVQNAGLRITAIRWLDDALSRDRSGKANTRLGSLTARDWVLQAQSTGSN
jgi:hypothetical protein